MITRTHLASFELISAPRSFHGAHEAFQNLPQINSDLHLVHTLSGHGYMHLAGRRYRTDPSCIMCVEPHIQCLYEKHPGQPWEMINLHILLSIGTDTHTALPTRFSPPGLPHIHQQLRAIHQHTLTSDPMGKARALAGALALIASYLDSFASFKTRSALADPLIAKTCQTLDAQASRPIDVDTLAADMGLSPSQLARRFKKETSLSIKQYWSQKRLTMTQSLLRDTDWPLARIADHLHFSDVFYLSRWFSLHAKLSPSQYRKKSRSISH